MRAGNSTLSVSINSTRAFSRLSPPPRGDLPMKITWQDLEGVIKRSGKGRRKERERELPRLQPVINLTSTPAAIVSSFLRFAEDRCGMGGGLDRPPPTPVFYDRVQPPDKKPVDRCKEFPVRSKYPSFCTRVTSLPGNTDLFGPFPPFLLYPPPPPH